MVKIMGSSVKDLTNLASDCIDKGGKVVLRPGFAGVPDRIVIACYPKEKGGTKITGFKGGTIDKLPVALVNAVKAAQVGKKKVGLSELLDLVKRY